MTLLMPFVAKKRAFGLAPLRPYSAVILVTAIAGWGIPAFASRSALFVWTTALIYTLLAMGTNIIVGRTGILSFGQVAYFGIGGYSAALLQRYDFLSSPPIIVLAGATLAAIAGVAFALTASRTLGVEFALLTLVFGEILYLLIYRVPLLGGDDGIGGLDRATTLGVSLAKDKAFFHYVLVFVFLGAVTVKYLDSSCLGVSMNAVKDAEVRAAALGIRVRVVRVASFAMAAFFAGLAGALIVQLQGVASASLGSWLISAGALLMILIGGLGTFWGPIAGAIVYTWSSHLFFGRADNPRLYLGLLFLGLLLLLPKGLAGAIELMVRGVSAISSRRKSGV